MESMRALKRRLSNIIYQRMDTDQNAREGAGKATGPGGHSGTILQSTVTNLTPDIGSSDKPLPEPASSQPKPAIAAVS
jgi:transposase